MLSQRQIEILTIMNKYKGSTFEEAISKYPEDKEHYVIYNTKKDSVDNSDLATLELKGFIVSNAKKTRWEITDPGKKYLEKHLN